MSLGIVFKGPEGIVLAADSRVTLHARILDPQDPKKIEEIASYYDNATKLLYVNKQPFIGVVTYGVGAIGQKEPRTAHSYIPEFQDEIPDGNNDKNNRLSVKAFSKKMSDFFLDKWNRNMPTDQKIGDMAFLVGGYDDEAPYGTIFEFHIPSKPEPFEQMQDKGTFGLLWGGQREYADRLMQGFDGSLPQLVKQFAKLSDDQAKEMLINLRGTLTAKIPYQFLPLQDCVDLSIFLIRTTIMMQKWIVGIRGVGGAIDVATITRTECFKIDKKKTIFGEICKN